MADPASSGFNWLSLFGAGFFGAFVVKAVDILYAELRRRADRRQSAASFLDSHMIPYSRPPMPGRARTHLLSGSGPCPAGSRGGAPALPIRIVDRIAQRAIGELLIKPGTSPPRTIGYVEFVRMVEGNDDSKRWITPLSNALLRTQHARVRQQLLQYGIIVHALIDTLDANHLVIPAAVSVDS